jgi:hypothetical protein
MGQDDPAGILSRVEELRLTLKGLGVNPPQSPTPGKQVPPRHDPQAQTKILDNYDD